MSEPITPATPAPSAPVAPPAPPAAAARTPRGPGRVRTLLGIAIALAVLVPLAFAGIVIGALNGSTDRLDAIPAALVNEDQLVTTTGTDGAKQQVLAGRLIVSALTGEDNPAFDWRLMGDADDAQKALDDGDVYVVLTIPKDFSASIASLQGDDPQKASFSIATDDSHDYLASAAASLLASTLQSQLGTQLSEQYIQGLYEGLTTIGSSLDKSATGAEKLADGGDQLADGLDKLADGADQSASGAHDLADGAEQSASGAHRIADGLDQLAPNGQRISGGVDDLSAGLQKLSTGLTSTATGTRSYIDGVGTYVGRADQLADGADALDSQLSAGVALYTDGVGDASDGIQQLNAAIQGNPFVDQSTKDGMARAAQGLATLKTQGGQLSKSVASGLSTYADGAHRFADGGVGLVRVPSNPENDVTKLYNGIGSLSDGLEKSAAGAPQLASGLSQVADGVSKSAAGSDQLASGLDDLASGQGQLASGLDDLADGAHQSADGAHQSADGADSLASGLRTFADSVPANDTDAATQAKAITSPVTHTSTVQHRVDGVGAMLATVLVPLGLWVGALAILLVLGSVPSRVLASSVSTARIVRSRFTAVALPALVQTVLMLVLLHAVIGVRGSALPLTIPLALLASLAFAAFHQLLTTAFGRAGLIISLLLLAVQIVTVGALFPLQIVSPALSWLSPLMPVTWTSDALQAVISDGALGGYGAALAGLAILGLVSLLLTGAVLRSRRRARPAGVIPQTV